MMKTVKIAAAVIPPLYFPADQHCGHGILRVILHATRILTNGIPLLIYVTSLYCFVTILLGLPRLISYSVHQGEALILLGLTGTLLDLIAL